MLELSSLTDNHPFSEFVRILGRGKTGSRSLTQTEAKQAMTMILNGEATDAQIGAFLMLLRVQEETAEEMAGFVEASQAHFDAPEIAVDIDWSSYAGKKNQLPWNLLAAKLLAQQGYSIFMHGAFGTQENRLYTEDACKAVGIAVATDWSAVTPTLATDNIVYMGMASLSRQFNELLFSRRLFGLRSAMHSIARLANPLNAPISLQGIFHPSYGETHQQASLLLNRQGCACFKGEGGEAEIRPEARTKIHLIRAGIAAEVTWPKQYPTKPEKLAEINPEQLNNVWHGDQTDDYGEAAVVSTAALVLYIRRTDYSIEQAFEQAKNYWQNRH